MNNEKGTNTQVILVIYEIIYALIVLKILQVLALSEVVNAGVTAVMTLMSAVLIGKTFIEERNAGRGTRSLTLLSLCALITVFVLYKAGLYG